MVVAVCRTVDWLRCYSTYLGVLVVVVVAGCPEEVVLWLNYLYIIAIT